MPKFRKRPVVIEARLYDGKNAAEILYWIGRSPAAIKAAESGLRLAFVNLQDVLLIRTLEGGDGYHHADPGDWIIQGFAGEFYPCKPDIFAATYEPVSEQRVGVIDAGAPLPGEVVEVAPTPAQEA